MDGRLIRMASPRELIRQYCDHVRNLATKSDAVRNGWDVKHAIDKKSLSAIVRAKLTFVDGATLAFVENVDWDRAHGAVRHNKYSYQYRTGDEKFYFRYERDTEAALDERGAHRYDHAENHLHANSETPRYITHATSFEEVFRFIHACFYPDQASD